MLFINIHTHHLIIRNIKPDESCLLSLFRQSLHPNINRSLDYVDTDNNDTQSSTPLSNSTTLLILPRCNLSIHTNNDTSLHGERNKDTNKTANSAITGVITIYQPNDGTSEISFKIRFNPHGNGYLKEALLAVLDHVFDNPPVRDISVKVAVADLGTRRLMGTLEVRGQAAGEDGLGSGCINYVFSRYAWKCRRAAKK